MVVVVVVVVIEVRMKTTMQCCDNVLMNANVKEGRKHRQSER